MKKYDFIQIAFRKQDPYLGFFLSTRFNFNIIEVLRGIVIYAAPIYKMGILW